MDDWPDGHSTGCFYQQSVLTCLETIKDHGFDSIEVCSLPNRFDYDNSVGIRLRHLRIRDLRIKADPQSVPDEVRNFWKTMFRAAGLSDRKDL